MADEPAVDQTQEPSPQSDVAIAEPAVVAPEAGKEPSTEAVQPTTYTAEQWLASPEFQRAVQSQKDKEIAAERSRIQSQAAEAEQARAAAERRQLIANARAGDLEAQQKLAEDEYLKDIAASSAAGFQAQWRNEALTAARELAGGDAELEARLYFGNFPTVAAWTTAMADARVAKHVAETEARQASERAVARNTQANPDTAEMVGGHGGPVASLSLDELNARYAKAKDDGNSEEVVRLRSVIRQKDTALAGALRR